MKYSLLLLVALGLLCAASAKVRLKGVPRLRVRDPMQVSLCHSSAAGTPSPASPPRPVLCVGHCVSWAWARVGRRLSVCAGRASHLETRPAKEPGAGRRARTCTFSGEARPARRASRDLPAFTQFSPCHYLPAFSAVPVILFGGIIGLLAPPLLVPRSGTSERLCCAAPDIKGIGNGNSARSG